MKLVKDNDSKIIETNKVSDKEVLYVKIKPQDHDDNFTLEIVKL